MLIDQLQSHFKDKTKIFENGRLFFVQQNLNQNSDFLTISWMINQLERNHKVVFLAFRQNYAHFLSLSKKLGKSIQPYLKSKQLKYYECFQSSFCRSELPLTQTSPNSYISPPTLVTKLKVDQIMKTQNLIEQDSTVIIDAIDFVSQQYQIIFKLYEEALGKNCKLFLGGAMQGSKITEVFKPQIDLYIKLQNDVGNHGKIRLYSNAMQISVLWKHVQGKFQLTQYIKL